MINVLVAGSNGQLGKCLTKIAHKHSNINFILTDVDNLDITVNASVKSFFNKHKPIAYCINCAAYTAVDKAESEPEIAKAINFYGVKNLAIACKKHNTALIHISTDFVFDGKSNIPYVETAKPNPISVYGKTKLQGEEAIKSVLNTYYIIRTSWLYSEFGNNFLKTMLKLGKEKSEITVVNDLIGSPTNANDLSDIIIKMVLSNNNSYGVYHYSNNGQTSWYDFAMAIFKYSNIRINLTPISSSNYATPAKRPMFSVLNTSKIQKEFNIEIPEWLCSLKQTISIMINKQYY